MSLPIGQMRDKFLIQKPVTAQNSYGENIPLYDDVREIHGYLKSLSGRQLQLAQANTITSTATHQIICRYSADIVAGLSRLKLVTPDKERVFQINFANDEDNRHVKLTLTVTEVVA